MRAAKVFSLLFAIGTIVTLSSGEILAQDTKSPAKVPLIKEDKSSPFKVGKTIITEVRFEGLDGDFEEYEDAAEKSIYEKDFRRILREQRASISEGELFRPEKVEKVIKLLKEWLAQRGYLKANVVALGRRLPKNEMRLILSVERGAPVFVSEIRFEGMRNVTYEELINDFHKCLGDRSPVFDRRLYEYCAKKNSRSLMFSHGFFKAQIRKVAARLVGDNYIVTIEVEEGIRYRWGEIQIEGETVFSEKEILEMMGQKSGDVANGKDLQDSVYDRLKQAYGERGFVQYAAEFDPTFFEPPEVGLDGRVDVLITIDEGRKFSIRRIVFTGVEKEEEKMLIEGFLLKERDVFVQSKLEASIENINKMNLFYRVDTGSDVEIRTDDESGDLDLVIKLTKIR